MMYVIEKISVPIKCSRLLIEMMKKDLQQRTVLKICISNNVIELNILGPITMSASADRRSGFNLKKILKIFPIINRLLILH